MRKVQLFSLFILLYLSLLTRLFAQDLFASLEEKLVNDGFSLKLIKKLYQQPQVKFLDQTIRIYMTYKESRLNYRQFLDPRLIRMGKAYLKEHKDILLKAQSKYGVSPYIIVALLTIETRLGQYLGRYRVFNVLSSLALVGINKDLSSSLNLPQTLIPRLEKRGKWAYKELKAFLCYTQKNGFDPLFIKGSLAGAFGIPQFVPTSAIKFGCDGDGDGRVNLFDHDDAIMSVAKYLWAHGWKPNLTQRQKEKILMSYNHSPYYTHTILNLAQRVED